MPHLVLLEPILADRMAELAVRLGPQWRAVTATRDGDKAALAEALAQAEIVIAHDYEAALPPAPRLRLVQMPGAGFDRIDFAALPAGCAVCNVFEHETGIAEYVMLGMLEWVIGMRGMDRGLRTGDWSGSPSVGSRKFHGELAGKTLGIVGFGHIGRAVAERARPFGMQVAAFSRTPLLSPLLDWAAPLAALDERLPECDFLLVACPLVAATRGLIDARRLSLMRNDAVLINVARGEVVDEDALYEALAARTIAGAVIDTWYVYPTKETPRPLPSRRPFHLLDNVIMTPHASGWTDKLFDRRWRVMVENIERFASGGEPRNVVGYGERRG